ncbi:hypothetical protein HYH03_000248 [Edaphochlamys debaryana]|uniref:type I protein arginine methyltransferase n=1 Tax=Edaphochlamys debaryana TaxID=47281 RepID=A0A836C711_9CHLO|nr:hypothetical protein HYH03_000248 [Edaphochlamys debaryana]|eukprot:KAG2501748.1 hypothetical protein HYH03_000248 [Edaphochlamys debaryana]
MTHEHDEETGSYVSTSEEEDDVPGQATNAAGDEEEWDEWQGGADDADEDVTKSLFGPERLPNPEAAMAHDAAKHGFDLRQFAIQEGLDEYGIIRVINYCRTEVAAGRDPLSVFAAAGGAAGPQPWRDDRYLVPALEDDALLCYDFEEVAAAAAAAAAGAGPSGSGGAAAAPSAAELAALRSENEALRAALEAMRNEFLPEELREGGEGPSTSAAAGDAGGASTSGGAAAEAAAAAAGLDPEAAEAAAVAAAAAADKAKKVDQAYFESYSYFDIHREMLGDKPRTEAYRDALERNPGLVKGARVMDVGCGTGILSLFACRAGAQRVVAIDGSERIAGFARRHAELAGYADSQGGPMSVVTGKVEELDGKLPVEQVDVIVSEWMGYALLFETMLDTVLHARDRYLRPGGAVLPDRASIYIAGASAAAGGLGFWKDVYGFDMTPVAQAIAEAGRGQAVVLEVKQEHIRTSTACVKELDMCTMKPEDQDFTANFRLEALPASGAAGEASPQAGGGGSPEVGCITLWFDTAFSSRHCADHPVLLTTSPFAPTTHWVQTLLTLRTPVPLASAAEPGRPGATAITGRLSMVRAKHAHRSLDIGLTYRAELSDGRVIEEAQLYHMSVTAPA